MYGTMLTNEHSSVCAGNVSRANANAAANVVTAVAPGELEIRGGTYTVDPSAYLASGYVATENNGMWTVSAAE